MRLTPGGVTLVPMTAGSGATASPPAVAQPVSDIYMSGPDPAAQPKGYSSVGRSWTPIREAMLAEMWAEGATALQIADAIGDLSRAAVVAKAYSLGLRAQPGQNGLQSEDRFRILDAVGDPLATVVGGSIRAHEVVRLKWHDGVAYLGYELGRIVDDAAARAEPETAEGPPVVTAAQFLAALLVSGSSKGQQRWTRPFLEILRDRMPKPLPIDPDLRLPESETVVLRWDVVDILASAANIRALLDPKPGELELPHVLAAYILSPPGQLAVDELELGDHALEPYRRFARSVLDFYASERKLSGLRGSAVRLIDELQTHPRDRPPSTPRAGYASDRVNPANIDPDIARDARALADLILLEAAAPPLAIGLFGAWGSGKSTLLEALRSEIAVQAAEERDLIAAGSGEEDSDTRRVAGVLQVELNAWSFIDSDNLWASLTSDIFEQIAAGGKGAAKAAGGAKLVAAVAERAHKEAALLKDAQTQRQEGEAQRDAADKAAAEAARDGSLTAFDAAFAVLADMVAAVPKAGADAACADAAVEPEDRGADAASAAKRDEDSNSKDSRSETRAITLFRDAVLVGSDLSAETKIKAYLNAATPARRLFQMAQDYISGRGLMRAALWALAGVALAAGLFVGVRAVLPAASTWVRVIVPLATSALAFAGGTVLYALPAIRAAALFKAKYDEKKRDAVQRELTASKDRRLAEASIARAKEAEATSLAFLAKYGAADGSGAPPALMLDYLLEDSPEIAQLRGSLGTLGTVRRAFERLDALVSEQKDKRNGGIERIIITIDDLDRCSERQVVQILEAIHLLLAFPCFVVVAAVDARWLEKALITTHSQLVSIETDAPRTGDEVATPADYLEKIFQIAYWVRPLRTDIETVEGGSYGRMINELTGYQGSDAPPEESDSGAPDSEPAPLPLEMGGTIEPVEPWAPDRLMAATRERVRIGGEERRLFHMLGPLAMRSPRAVKRMINVYRMLRVDAREVYGKLMLLGPDGEEVPAPIVQFALACEAGLPAGIFAGVAFAVDTLDVSEWESWMIAMQSGPSQTRLHKVLETQLRFETFFEALRDANHILDRNPTIHEMQSAFALTGRYSFRRPLPPLSIPV